MKRKEKKRKWTAPSLGPFTANPEHALAGPPAKTTPPYGAMCDALGGLWLWTWGLHGMWANGRFQRKWALPMYERESQLRYATPYGKIRRAVCMKCTWSYRVVRVRRVAIERAPLANGQRSFDLIRYWLVTWLAIRQSFGGSIGSPPFLMGLLLVKISHS